MCNQTLANCMHLLICYKLLTRRIQVLLDIINYVGRFLPDTEEICKPLHRLTWTKTEWTWNSMYQELYEKAKTIIKDDVSLKFYNEEHCALQHLQQEPDQCRNEIQQHRKRDIRHTSQPLEIPPLLFCPQGKCYNRPQVISGHIQKGHGNSITKVTVDPAMHTQVQDKDPTLSWLVIQTQP